MPNYNNVLIVYTYVILQFKLSISVIYIDTDTWSYVFFTINPKTFLT